MFYNRRLAKEKRKEIAQTDTSWTQAKSWYISYLQTLSLILRHLYPPPIVQTRKQVPKPTYTWIFKTYIDQVYIRGISWASL